MTPHPPVQVERDGYVISTDPAKLDVMAMHTYLTTSYWSPGIPLETLTRAAGGSLCFGLFHGGLQVGLARVITDGATFAYLCDVYVLDAHRGRGLGKWLMETVAAHPALQGLRRFVLITRDAHGLYEHFGFKPLARPQGYMEIHHRDLYRNPGAAGG